MPHEFWREVVDRVAAEAPDTLLLAEAFWLMEGYFVRTLGMHRVYNSAFMHMLRDEDNAGYRKVIRDTIEFDPEILKRYVNFMTNPDEETAIEQFGTGEKYFGIATLLATMPGLPMIGHGQIEGFTEKYGMEFQRAYRDEQPNEGLAAYFDEQIAPLLRDRRRYAGSADFRLYDVATDGGAVVEDVFAYSNGRAEERSLIVYHNRFGSTSGWIRDGVAFAERQADGSKRPRRESLAEGLRLEGPDDAWLRIRDRRAGRETLRSLGELRSQGLFLRLEAYGCLVLDELREVASTADEPWTELAASLGGGWVPSLDEALAALRRGPTKPVEPPLEVRQLRAGDGPAVLRLLEADPEYFAVSFGEPPGPADVRELLRGAPAGARPGAKRLVGGYEGDRLVAVAELIRDHPRPGVWTYGFLLVHPDRRRAGIGRRMTDWVERTVAEGGGRTIRFDVIEANEASRTLFERRGYREVARRRQRTGRRTHVVLTMERELAL
jgi:ribosomal protein S18 acetylase RimI-like enzyme